MYKPGGGRSPRPCLRGTPPLKAELVTQKYSFSFIFDRFYSVFIFSPPPELDFGGAPFPPEFAVFLGVYRCFYIFAPPWIGIHIIRNVAQNVVLLTVFMVFLYFRPPLNWIPMAPKRVFTKVSKPFLVPWRIYKVFCWAFVGSSKHDFTKGFQAFRRFRVQFRGGRKYRMYDFRKGF